jgi:hypothetical protein
MKNINADEEMPICLGLIIFKSNKCYNIILKQLFKGQSELSNGIVLPKLLASLLRFGPE